MKFFLLIVILLFAACGEPDKKTGNNENNIVVNNVNNVNNGNNANNSNNTNNSNNVIIVINNANNINNQNNTTGNMCDSRADCRVDQECVANTCNDHLNCFSGYDGECAFDWTNCNDGKEYAVRCELGAVNAFCTCFVNGEDTGEIVATIENFCEDPTAAHRIANEQCGWLVPEVLF